MPVAWLATCQVLFSRLDATSSVWLDTSIPMKESDTSVRPHPCLCELKAQTTVRVARKDGPACALSALRRALKHQPRGRSNCAGRSETSGSKIQERNRGVLPSRAFVPSKDLDAHTTNVSTHDQRRDSPQMAPRVRIVVASIGLEFLSSSLIDGGRLRSLWSKVGAVGNANALSTASRPVREAHRPQIHSLAGTEGAGPFPPVFNAGAMVKERIGSVRTEIQGRRGGEAAAAGGRCGGGCGAGNRSERRYA